MNIIFNQFIEGKTHENKRPKGFNGHLSIGDFTLTLCQKGTYLHITNPIIEINRRIFTKWLIWNLQFTIMVQSSLVFITIYFVCLISAWEWRRRLYLALYYTWHSWPLSSEATLACHTLCDSGHPFIMVISKDPEHSHLFQSADTTCFYD